MFISDLLEGRDAPLYHGTSMWVAEEILSADALSAHTRHKLPLVDKTVMGVSLSRSLRTSRRFGSVIFELDQSKLARKHRIVPIDYFHNRHSRTLDPDEVDPNYERRRGGYAEAEEFVVGDIKKLSRYLRAVHFFGDEFKLQGLPSIFYHPLLKVHDPKTYAPD